MRKNFKLFLLAASVASLGIAATAPILVSCANSSTTKIYFDGNNQQLNVNNSKLVFSDANDNLFNAYKNLISTDAGSADKVKTYEANLEKLCNDYFSKLNLDNVNMTFDFDNIQIDGWSIIIPTTFVSTYSSEEYPALWCKNTKVSFSKKNVDSFLENNTITVKASEAFPGSSLSDIEAQLKSILDLKPTDPKYEEFFSRISKWTKGSIIFQANDFERPTYEEFTDEDGTTNLRILIFTSNKGLGQLVIENDNQITTIQPSASMKNTFGTTVQNEWSAVSSDTTIPSTVDKIDFTNYAASPSSKILSSYDYALTLDDITNKINDYISSNFLSNLKNDMNFFFKNYLNSLQTEWNEPGLLLNSVFVANNLKTNGSTISGSVGMEIKNISNGTKKITLPVIGDVVSVNSKATISIIIKFDNSSVKAYLTPSTSAANQAYLTTSFNNVTVTANEIISTTNNGNNVNESVNNLVTKNYSNYINVFPYSCSIKTIVTNIGYGNTIANSSSLLAESLNALTIDELKNAKVRSIETIYQQTITGVNVAQSILTKIAKNPTVFDFLQDISSEINKLVILFTGDTNLASIASDMFSTKSASDYLYANLGKIIAYLQELAKTAPQLSYIIDMLVIIKNNNQTPEQMKEWVASIKDLYPTLEKLLGANLKWIMPLLETVMTSISNDNPPIITLIFNNLEDIFSFVLGENASNLDANLVAMLKSIYDYLNTIVKFSSDSSSSTSNADKYKTIKVLDILSYELTATTRGSTLLALIVNVFKVIQPDSTIPNLLTTINNMIGSQIIVPSTIYDYSTATWDNELDATKKSIKNYRIKSTNASAYSVKLSTYFGKIINSFLNVKIGNDTSTTPIADMLSWNTTFTTTKNEFKYDASNHTVTQDLSMRMSFKETVTIDTLPICVLLDNIKLNVSLGNLGSINTSKESGSISGEHTTITPNKLNVNVSNLNALLDNFLPGASKLIPVQSISLNLGSIFPTDIVIKNNNFVDLNYKTSNAPLSPLVDSRTGAINWSYQANENVTINYNDSKNGILASSNIKYRISSNNNLSKQMYYGSKFNVVTKTGITVVDKILPSEGYFGADVSAKALFVTPVDISIGLLPLLANFDGNYSKSIMIGTNLSSPKKIENYNSSVFIPGAAITQKQTTTAFKSYLSNVIDKYGQWTTNSSDGTTKFSLKDGNNIAADLSKYFTFGNAFTNNKYVTYKYGFDAIAYKLLNDTYEYTFHIYLSTPTNYTTIADGATAAKSSLVTTISFTVTSNKAPTGVK